MRKIVNEQSGFSFIELMISVAVLGVVFLGVSSSFINLMQASGSFINKTTYDSIYHSYFKKIKYGAEGTLLENIDPSTSLHLRFLKGKSVEAYKVVNTKWREFDPDMLLTFESGLGARIKVDNWTFLKYLPSESGGKSSENLEVIFSRCIPYKKILSKVTKKTLKHIYETKRYPVNFSGEVRCCSFNDSGKYKSKATCTELKKGYIPSTYSMRVKKKSAGYKLQGYSSFINTHDMDSVFALGFTGNFFLDYSDRSPTSASIDFFTYKNLCKTSLHPSASCAKIKKFTAKTLTYNVARAELYNNIKLKSMSWPVNVYSTLLDSGNVVVY